MQSYLWHWCSANKQTYNTSWHVARVISATNSDDKFFWYSDKIIKELTRRQQIALRLLQTSSFPSPATMALYTDISPNCSACDQLTTFAHLMWVPPLAGFSKEASRKRDRLLRMYRMFTPCETTLGGPRSLWSDREPLVSDPVVSAALGGFLGTSFPGRK